jgi:hypothetical protein
VSADEPASRGDLSDEEKNLAIQRGEAWAMDYLERVPFEDIYRSFAMHAVRQLPLALGPRYGKHAASQVLEVIGISISDAGLDEHVRWRISEGDPELLQDRDESVEWQELSSEFANFYAFARYGYGSQMDPEDSRAEIEKLIAHFRRVVADDCICAAAGVHVGWLRDTTAAAEARWAIDHGRSVKPEDLAALAGVKPKTIANLLAAREISPDADGRVPAAEALRYLQRRDDFVPSNWQFSFKAPDTLEDTGNTSLAEQVFVPVDGDGNPFLPSIARRGRDGVLRYAIGAKSEPEYVEDFWEALDRLARMPTPRWRRPPASGKGGWSLVSAQDGWRRFARTDLERMVEAVREGSDVNPRPAGALAG